MITSACSKLFEFIGEAPTTTHFDSSFPNFTLPKNRKRKFEELSKTEQFDVLDKYTETLCAVINVEDRVHVFGNHGAATWSDIGVDT